MKRLFLFLVLLACDSRDYRISRAREFMQNWNYDRAMMELGRIKNNKDAEANFLLGQCYMGKNNYDEAYNSFRQAAQLDTTYIDSICAIYKNLIQKALKID
ncbi:MAG: tetratricopeptide repeat protein, partial [candidate division WOR-3 bacterium]